MFPVLDFRRRLKVAGDALDGVLRDGVSLCGSLGLTRQWNRVVAVGPVTPDDL